jgi:hypothetical protein
LDRIRYRICKIAEDIIKLEEMLGYLLEALDVIEIPPEPPEQAGRSLYERLEISGMRSQLLRRTTDLKKNVGGASRYLEVLREMTGIVAEDRAYNLQRHGPASRDLGGPNSDTTSERYPRPSMERNTSLRPRETPN